MLPEKKKNKRKIAIIAGSRGEYGYYRPIIQEIKKRKNLDYGFIVTNMHVLESFGSSVNEMRGDKMKINAVVHNTLDGYNRITMVKSLSILAIQLPELMDQMKADIILLAGDRGEQLMGAITGAYLHIPVAHIQAGELSGNIDGMTRHAITKFAHLHFASNEDAAKRLKKMGEEHHRIFNTGAPQLDEFIGGRITPSKEIYEKFSLDSRKPVVLLVQHSVTEELDDAKKQIEETLEALSRVNQQTIVVLSNSDAGGNIIRETILNEKKPYMKKVVPNMKREDYAGLLNVASVIVGNSSSGILEAPTFKLPAVNIGNRQKGRVQAINVINVGYSADQIEKALKKALNPSFKKKMEKCKNPYGDGKSAKRIVDILEHTPFDETLLVKQITY